MLVNAGAINTIKIAMIPITSINSSSVKAKRSRSFGNVKALRRSRCLTVKTRRVGNGDTNLSVQQRLEIVNLENVRLRPALAGLWRGKQEDRIGPRNR